MSPTPPSPNDLTRQQLDELDALLQRMLSLPLTPAADPPAGAAAPVPVPDPAAAPAGGWRADAAGAPTKAPYLSQAPAADPVAAAVAARFNGGYDPAAGGPDARLDGPGPVALAAPPATEPAAPPEPFAAPAPTLRGVDAPALPPGFGAAPPAEAPPEPAGESPPPEAPPEPVAETTPADPGPAAGPRVPVVLWPLFGANWAIETLLGLGGPVGAVATRPAVKHVLGGAGVVLLAGAGAWAARGMRWVEFPTPW